MKRMGVALVLALVGVLLFGAWAQADLTLTKIKSHRPGFVREVFYTAVFDTNYNTGGEALTPGDLGLSTIYSIEVDATAIAYVGYGFLYDFTNEELLVFAPNDTFAITGNAQTAYSWDFVVEPDADADLSGLTVRINAKGN